MTEQKRKEMSILSDTIIGEINRMCVTDKSSELDKMMKYAIKNIIKLHTIRFENDFEIK